MNAKEIHITDLNTFTGCRRRWDWQSTLRQGLQRAVVPEPLFTGLAVHIGLDAYHANGSNVYMAAAATKQWIRKRVKAVRKRTGPMWDAERQMVNDSHKLAMDMLKHYHLWHRDNRMDDRWEIVATEQRFKVPIPIPPEVYMRLGYMQAVRSGMYISSGGRWYSSRIQLAGRFDGLIRERNTGDLYLLEFKTSRSLDNIKWVMRGMQGTAYVYAARQMYGGQNVKGILYRVLRKKSPARPRILKRGGYSQAKNQDTSFRYFKHYLRLESAITGRNIKELYRDNEQILRHLHSRPEKFFMERIIPKRSTYVESAMRSVYYVGTQMVDPHVEIFSNPGWSTCAGCPFQDPCDLVELGYYGEAASLLDAEYAPRTYWEI